MKLPTDFRDALVCFADAGVEFVIVGGFAVAHHGYVRATKDIDVLVRASTENAAKVIDGLIAFGAPIQALKIEPTDFAHEGKIIQLGVPPLRIDLLTSVSGIDFDRAVNGASALEVEGRTIRVIGLDALLQNKRAAGRPQDLVDVAELERQRPQGSRPF